jgi:hypothetical protein
MSGFAVFRHPDVAVAGVVPFDAADSQRARDWYRVSDWQDSSTFDLPAFGADAPDLDAPPEPEPEPEPVDEADDENEDEEL